ncbi:hypothetical protein B0H17DRAFT_1274407 [Mycena rosella]|uniref:Uncharacterized protein n=1 Tax=Mycena rosella TaxID=1033263 RepID=A0AAD7DQ51_MYCRO|nr:hypothetical protein B0H17DRAFT_1274407 [Mycena rosella]
MRPPTPQNTTRVRRNIDRWKTNQQTKNNHRRKRKADQQQGTRTGCKPRITDPRGERNQTNQTHKQRAAKTKARTKKNRTKKDNLPKPNKRCHAARAVLVLALRTAKRQRGGSARPFVRLVGRVEKNQRALEPRAETDSAAHEVAKKPRISLSASRRRPKRLEGRRNGAGKGARNGSAVADVREAETQEGRGLEKREEKRQARGDESARKEDRRGRRLNRDGNREEERNTLCDEGVQRLAGVEEGADTVGGKDVRRGLAQEVGVAEDGVQGAQHREGHPGSGSRQRAAVRQ